MRQVPGCSAPRAEAIVRAFESPLGFMLALERAAESGREGGHICDVEKVEGLLAGLRCTGGAGTNKLPQPLRQFLRRLFVEEGKSVVTTSSNGGVDGRGATSRRGELSLNVGGEYAGCVLEPMSQDDPSY